MNKKASSSFYLHGAGSVRATAAAMPRRAYDSEFRPDPAYRASLPDLMSAPGTIDGPEVALPQVGISGFRLPLLFRTRDGGLRTLEATVTGTVSLAAQAKGINMSRLVRALAAREREPFTHAMLGALLGRFRRDAGSLEARVRVRVSYPMRQQALRSGLSGWQFHRVVLAGELGADGAFRRRMEFDFTYSSTCPCSAELAEHARAVRGVYAVPHSQRSKARLWVEIASGSRLAPEDLHRHCIQALNTETQVMVRREDEQAFGELNGAHLKFVEDAARRLHGRLDGDRRIADFRAACSHQESLHSHDAVAAVSKGIPGGYGADCDWDALGGGA